jgi:hypothetical protein
MVAVLSIGQSLNGRKMQPIKRLTDNIPSTREAGQLLLREWLWSSALSALKKAASRIGPPLPDYYLDSVLEIELAPG